MKLKIKTKSQFSDVSIPNYKLKRALQATITWIKFQNEKIANTWIASRGDRVMLIDSNFQYMVTKIFPIKDQTIIYNSSLNNDLFYGNFMTLHYKFRLNKNLHLGLFNPKNEYSLYHRNH